MVDMEYLEKLLLLEDAENYFEKSEHMIAKAGYTIEGCHMIEKILEEQ